MKVRNTFIIFLVSGFWHGANWTFIVWGALNAIYFMPLLLTNKNRDNLQIVAAGKTFPTFKELFSMLLTFGLTCFAWIFFRAKDMSHALAYIKHMFSRSLFSSPNFYSISDAKKTMLFILVFLVVEWIGREQPYAIAKIGNVKRRYIRWLSYYAIIWVIINYSTKEQTFIYFQF